jgi:hypothetical protein
LFRQSVIVQTNQECYEHPASGRASAACWDTYGFEYKTGNDGYIAWTSGDEPFVPHSFPSLPPYFPLSPSFLPLDPTLLCPALLGGLNQKLTSSVPSISWVDDVCFRAWTVYQSAIGPNPRTEVSTRIIPEEPMYILINLGISNNFGAIDWEGYVDFLLSFSLAAFSPFSL